VHNRWSAVPLRMWKNPNDEPQGTWCHRGSSRTKPGSPLRTSKARDHATRGRNEKKNQ